MAVALAVVAVALGAAGLLGRAGNGSGGAGGSAGVGGPAGTAVRLEVDAAVPVEVADRVRVESRAAVAFVAALWPGAWSRQVEVTVVADTRALARAAPGPGLAAGQGDGIAALAVVPLGGRGGGVSPEPATGRLVVNAAVYARLSDLGARVVLRHEVTHLASAAATPPDMPVWLVEGFADAVGHTASGLDVARLAPELAADVSGGWLPTDLPAAAAFAAADGRAAQAYQQAWLACRMILDDVGMSGLVRFYRAAGTGNGDGTGTGGGGGGGDPADRLEVALDDVLGTSYPQFVAAWRAYLGIHLTRSNPPA